MVLVLQRWIVLLAFLVATVVVSVHVAILLEYPFQVEYGEGSVLTFVSMLAHHEPLYPDIRVAPFRACIYAPLFPWLAAQLGGQQPGLACIRALASAPLLLVVVLLGWHLFRRAGATAALTGMAFFLGHALVVGWSAIGRVDTLALAFSVLALLLAEHGGRAWRTDLAVAGLLALALLCKQSYICAGVALVGSWLFQDRWRALRLLVAWALLAGGGFGLLNLATEGGAYRHMFGYNAGTSIFLTEQVREYSVPYLLSIAGLLALSLAYAWKGGLRTELTWYLFSAGSLVLAVSSTGRIGGYYNYFLEPHYGLALLGGLASVRLGRWALALVVLQLGLGFGCPLPPVLYSPWQYLRYETSVATWEGRYPRYLDKGYAAAALEPWLARHPGPLLAENMGNAMALGYPSYICDPVYFYFLSMTGMWDETPLLQAIAERRFSVVLLQKTDGNLRYSPRVIATVLQNYHPVGTAGPDTIFRPKSPAGWQK